MLGVYHLQVEQRSVRSRHQLVQATEQNDFFRMQKIDRLQLEVRREHQGPNTFSLKINFGQKYNRNHALTTPSC